MLTQVELKSLLDYNSITGLFKWKNLNYSTTGCINGDGYINIKINNKIYLAHQLAVLYITGIFPIDQVDHGNHIRSDNRWSNLSEATYASNSKNKSKAKNNTSGVTGVRWNKRDKRWVARIKVNGKQLHLGNFKNKTDAIAARLAANTEYNFHVNHGT